jgi:hypothetical protein
VAQRDAIADLAEDLAGVAVVIGPRRLEQAREDDGAGGLQIVEGVSGAGPQVEAVEAGCGIDADMAAIDIGRAQALIHA